jgi:hypothetical protein
MTDYSETEDLQTRLQTDPDFICNRRYNYSLSRLLARFPDGVPARVAARSLMMSEEELKGLEDRVIGKLRRQLKVK